MQGADDRFPSTRPSLLLAIRSDDPVIVAKSLQAVAAAYWKPIYKYLRVKCRKPAEDAADLTQAFFASALEKKTFGAYEPAKGRFRPWLKTCVDHFVANDDRNRRAAKRGGGAMPLNLDFHPVEAELGRSDFAAGLSFDDYFHAEWARHLLSRAVEACRAECEAQGKSQHFCIFERYDLADDEAGRPSYAQIAEELGISTTEVYNRLSYARRELRRIVLADLRNIVATDEELRTEALALLGVRL